MRREHNSRGETDPVLHERPETRVMNRQSQMEGFDNAAPFIWEQCERSVLQNGVHFQKCLFNVPLKINLDGATTLKLFKTCQASCLELANLQ